MRKISHIFIFLIIISGSAFGQFRSETLRKADKLFESHKYYEAIDYYVLAIEEAPYMQEVVYKVASLYKSNNALLQAEKWYKEILKFKVQDYAFAKFEYASILKQLGKYEEAITNAESFIKYYRRDDKSEIRKTVEKFIKGCDRAMMSENDPSFEVINLVKANSSYTDLSPFIFQDTLYFSSIKTDTPLIYLDDIGIKVQMNLQKIGFDSVEDTLQGSPAIYGPEKKVGENFHYGAAVFTKNGQTMLFSKCTTDEAFKNHCDIYGAKLQNNKWSEPIKLGPTVNDELGLTSSTHPCLAPHRRKNKNILYFSSDKKGGMGGYDLWTVEIDKDFVCSRAKNLGRKINSTGDEITPSYSRNERALFFSSNGHIGFGGFDIFRVKKEGKRFKNISALEGPFNTSSDDFFFQNYGRDKYILVSNREGAKAYHNQYVLDDMFIVKKVRSKKYLIANVFLQDSISTTLDSTSIQMVSISASINIDCNKVTRVFPDQDYTLSTNIDGFINDSKTISISESSPDTTTINLTVSKIEQEKEIQLKNIYFAFNSDSLTDSSKFEINLLYTILINNPQFKIEIGAHTDDIGKDKANQELSQRRAQSVVNYLISKDISKNRLVATGYGESKPIALNKNSDGSDNPEGRQLNRRIVFKIIGLVEIKPIIIAADPTKIVQSADTTYAIQVGVFSTEIDSLKFNDIQPIYSNKTDSDLYKYTSRPYATFDSATTVKEKIISMGYPDAFILPLIPNSIFDSSITNITNITTRYRVPASSEQSNDSTITDFKVNTTDTLLNPIGITEEHTDSIGKILFASENFIEDKIYYSDPVDVSVTKDNFRWVDHAVAQKITTETEIIIESLRVIAKKKTGVVLSIKVIDAVTGVTIEETSDYTIPAVSSAPGWMMRYFDITININLRQGTYYIFPVIKKGNIAFLPNLSKENNFDNQIIIHSGMYCNYKKTAPWNYQFKGTTQKHYGPFLKFKLQTLKKELVKIEAPIKEVQKENKPQIILDSTKIRKQKPALKPVNDQISVSTQQITTVQIEKDVEDGEDEEDEEKIVKKTFISQPIDASPVKNKVRWLKRPSAQRITCSTGVKIDSLTVMAKEKVGVTFKIRVVKASNGKFIYETDEYSLEPNKKVSARLMKLFQVSTNIKLEKGSYFIFPIVTKGSLAFIPRFTKENSFEGGKVVIHKAMYTSYDNSKPVKYKFKKKEEKENTFINYGPFLKIGLEILPTEQ